MTRFVLLINPESGRGHALAITERLLEAGSALRSRARGVWPIASVRDAVSLLGHYPEDVVAVAAGGDGMANLVARAVLLEGGSRPMALLPLGTGNAFAHALGLARLSAAADALVAGRVRSIDVIRSDHPEAPLALVSISSGFEADFVRGLAERRRSLGAIGAGVVSLWRTSRRGRKGATVQLDGQDVWEPTTTFFNIGLYAQPCYAFGHRALAHSDPADGSAEARLSRTFGAYSRATLGGRPGTHTWRQAQLCTPGPLQIDGEPASGGRLSLWVDPQALGVVVAAG